MDISDLRNPKFYGSGIISVAPNVYSTPSGGYGSHLQGVIFNQDGDFAPDDFEYLACEIGSRIDMSATGTLLGKVWRVDSRYLDVSFFPYESMGMSEADIQKLPSRYAAARSTP